MGAPPRGRLESWIPRHSIVGRIVHPLFEERRSLAGRMSWIGLGLLVAFLVVALGANVIAPFDPILPTDAIHVPPWTTMTVARNETYEAWLAVGNWTQPSLAQKIDGNGTLTNATGDVMQLLSFPLDVKRDAVLSVGLLVVLLGNGTVPGQYLTIEASRDAGVTWFPPIDVRTFDRPERIDLTGLTSWHAADLTRDTLTLRITHRSDAGAGNLTIDYVGATADWQSYWHLMGTDAIGRDVFSRVLYDARTSLIIMIIAVPVLFSLGAADVILTGAGLSYLGLGLRGDIPDWGLDLSAGAARIDNGIWWSSFFPGLAIVLLTIGLSFLGEGLNDIINPLLKKERA